MKSKQPIKLVIAITLSVIAMMLITLILAKIILSIPKKPAITSYSSPSVGVNETTNTNQENKQITQKEQKNTYDSHSLVNKRYDNHVTKNPDGTKHYRNERYGVEFDFPGNWTASEPAFGGGNPEFNMEIISDSGNKYPEPILIATFPQNTGWIDKVIAYYKAKGNDEVTQIVVDKIGGVRYEDLSTGLPNIYNLFPIGDYWIDIEGKKEYEDVLDNILRSTKFFTPNYELK